jgi:hypothetical protein
MKGRRQVEEGFLSFETTETWICMCVIQRVNGQDKMLRCLWTGYGIRCQAHRLVSRTVTLLGFSCSTVSCVFQEWSSTERPSSQLDTTEGSIGVNMGQHPCITLSTTCSVHATTNWGCSEDKRDCNSILERFLMFCTLSLYSALRLSEQCVCFLLQIKKHYRCLISARHIVFTTDWWIALDDV